MQRAALDRRCPVRTLAVANDLGPDSSWTRLGLDPDLDRPAAPSLSSAKHLRLLN